MKALLAIAIAISMPAYAAEFWPAFEAEHISDPTDAGRSDVTTDSVFGLLVVKTASFRIETGLGVKSNACRLGSHCPTTPAAKFSVMWEPRRAHR